jgi:hypothetical protein
MKSFPFALLLLFSAILAILGLNWWYAELQPERGTFGDMFGAANALFSGLAFAGVAYAILLQRAEVAISREELERSRAIQMEQERLTQIQQDGLNRQMFENTFFKLLDLFVHLVEDLDIRTQEGRVIKGADVFEEIMRELTARLEDEDGAEPMALYAEIAARYKPDLGHYFRTLVNMLRFVDSAAIAQSADVRLYTNLIRAQITDPEATMLALHGLNERGASLKPLLEDYALLKNADLDGALEGLKGMYREGAFDQA